MAILLVAACGGGPGTSVLASAEATPASLAPSEVPSNPPASPSLPAAEASLAGSWSAAPPMGNARGAHAVVATDDAIYALAGTNTDGPVLEVERFDGTGWTVVATLPGEGLNGPAAVALAGRIYLIGGFGTTTNVPVADVLVLDPASAEWTRAAPLPGPRGGHAAAVVDGRIHVIGGGNASTTLADHDVYDPATDTWSPAAPLPRSEGSPAAAVLGDALHAIGGRSGPQDFGAVDVWDPATDAWASGPPISPRGTAGAAVVCETVYLFGGESQAEDRMLDEVLRLDSAAGWQRATPMPTARNFARAVALDGAVYVVGGSPTSDASHASPGSTVVERFEVPC
jgi:N-acetylneuraminic acid mutarotase